MDRDEERGGDRWLQAGLVVLGLVVGVFLRLERVGDQALFGDEYHTFEACEASVGTILTTFDRYGSHTVLPLLQHVSLALTDGVLALRLAALVPGILTLLLLPLLARRWYGGVPAVLGTWALALSPMHVYYSRFARSYALIVLLGLVLIALVERATRRDGPERKRWRTWALVGLVAVLLPYTHLSSGGFVAAVGLVALGLAWRRGGGVLPPLVAFGGAALVVVLLFLPMAEQVRFYFQEAIPPEERKLPTQWFGIPLLMAGGEVAAWAWMIGFPLGTLWLAREKASVALLGAAALFGPLVALVAARPHGMEFAYARYLLFVVPLVPPVVAWLVLRPLSRFVGGRGAGYATLALGLTALVANALTGPLGGERVPTGAFDNSYLAMRSLPAFDERWEDAPAVYAELARHDGELRVVETAPMLSRAVLLYRNHALRHEHSVAIGWPGRFPAGLHGAPYVSLDTITPEDADVVVLHTNLRDEVSDYWQFVYDTVWPRIAEESQVDRGFMLRHASTFVRGQPATSVEFAQQIETLLRQRLGPPTRVDGRTLVWWL